MAPETPRYGSGSSRGRRVPADELVEKLGDWKTIEQREDDRRKARRSSRRGGSVALLGASAAAGTIRAGRQQYVDQSGSNLRPSPAPNKSIGEAANIVRDTKFTLRNRKAMQPGGVRRLVGRSISHNPMGAVLLGTAGVTAAGVTGYAQGRARASYHQSKINQRRRENRRKRVSVQKGLIPTSIASKLIPLTEGAKTAGKQFGGGVKVGNMSRKGLASPLPNISKPATLGVKLGENAPALGAGLAAGYTGSKINKADRNYDAESARQRRMGFEAGAAGAAGAVLLHRGAKGVRQSTRIARDGVASLARHQPDRNEKEKQILNELQRRGVVGNTKDLAALGGGTALLGTSGGLMAYGRHRRNRRWV